MPNSLQWAFIASFLTTFAALFVASNILRSTLRDAGYDPANLILIGLNKDASNAPMSGGYTVPEWAQEYNLPAWAKDITVTNTQIASVILAVLTSIVIFRTFLTKRPPVLNPNEFKEFPLVQKTKVSPNTALYRFALPRSDDILGLPVGQHITVSAEIEGKTITRSYTPTSSNDDLGHFDLLVKTYEKGNISRYLSLLKIGDKIRIKGPKGQYTYRPGPKQEIGMIAGGTGITPMLQVINAAVNDPVDRTKLTLIYANVGEEDILLHKEIDDIAALHADRFKVYHVLNNPPTGWKGGVGFVSKEHIKEHLPPTAPNTKILMCGPPPMMTAMKKHLADLNYPTPRTVSKVDDQVFLF